MKMCEKSENATLNQLTLFAGGSHVKILVLPEKWPESLWGRVLAYGKNLIGSFAKLDQNLLQWKMLQASLFGKSEPYSQTWPKAGIMHNGKCYRQQRLVRHISGKDVSFLPTPVAYDSTPGGPNNHYKGLGWMGKHLWPKEQSLSGNYGLNPEYQEYLMGFTIGWTELEPLEIQ